ncbi:hypothetical protein H4V99_001269 [Cryobacterium sp. CG_9.6]|nr:hypothetical protein [Cryobacterium sp. CG_9.6]
MRDDLKGMKLYKGRAEADRLRVVSSSAGALGAPNRGGAL